MTTKKTKCAERVPADFGVDMPRCTRNAIEGSIYCQHHDMLWVNKVWDLTDRVIHERVRQMDKWGPQHNEFRSEDSAEAYALMETHYKTVFEEQTPNAGWDVILLEEVYEALAANTPEERVTELIQVAAVALAAAEDIESHKQ